MPLHYAHKKMKKILFPFVCLIIFTIPTLFAQTDYWNAVQQDFNERDGISGDVRHQIGKYAVLSDFRSRDMAQYLTFLYAYMPQSDLADYDFDFFDQQVKIACEAREAFSWGKGIPDDIFRHFVVVYRVNNEDLDTARAYIFHQLKDRIQNMSMYDAALEVNHWCHEQVDYQPADVRTSAPLATLKTSHGRCGEESTLTVTALRAVGIPARQCYTPRWAHCDDNHAWVEVWVDGNWWFLGACEPDPDLNMGWFAYPATRTMMVHTNVFGRYEGPEEVNKKTKYYSCINVLPNYADTVHMTVTVVDGQHKPIKGALVRFKLYNYAEYYTLAAKLTDENGQASLITGKGTLLVWASKDDMYTYSTIDGRTEHERTLVLMPKINAFGQPEHQEYWTDINIVPPTGNPDIPAPDPTRQARCDQRKHYEDSLREAYHNTFPTRAQTDQFHNEYFNPEEFYDIIHRSEGNHAEILRFLQNHSKKEEGLYLKEFINALTDKDLRDTKAETLESHLTRYRSARYPAEVFIKGVLPARISNELIRDWRHGLREALVNTLPGEVTPSVEQLTGWTKRFITIDPLCNYYNCPISPMGVFKTRRADAHSRDIFFVAACRSLFIPCYLDNASNQIYAWENGKWNSVTFEEKPVEEYKTLILHNDKKMGYYTQYTLQRFEDREFVSFDFENDPRVETDPIVLSVPAGYYCLSLGERHSDGNVFSQMQFFNVTKDTTERYIDFFRKIQDPALPIRYYGKVNLKKTEVGVRTLSSILKSSKKEHIILCLGTPGTEPVNHLMKEIAAKQSEYEAWNGPMFFVMKEGQWKSEPGEPKNLRVITEGYDELVEIFAKALDGELAGRSPMCFVIDKKGCITYFSEGYNIGVGGAMIEEVMKEWRGMCYKDGGAVTIQRKIQYSQGACLGKKRVKPLYFDLYEPAINTQEYRPLVITLFGGSFVAGSRDYEDMEAWCKQLARQGYMAASIDYRLISAGQLSGDNLIRAGYLTTLDVLAAIHYFKTHCDQYRIDTNRIFLLGQSAGATAILHAIYLDEDERPPETKEPVMLPALSTAHKASSRVAGAVILWGSIQNPTMIDADERTPVCLIHGKNDHILPIGGGNAFKIHSFPYVYGGQTIANRLTQIGQNDFEYHKFDNEGHAFYFKYFCLFSLDQEKFDRCFQIAVKFMDKAGKQ